MKKLSLILLILSLIFLGGCGESKTEKRDKLVFAQLSEPKTLDPHNAVDNYSQVAITQIYDRLFELNEKTTTVIPSLVESYKRVDENTLELVLKKDVKFTNGDTLTAEDVKFTLERAQENPKVAHLYKVSKRLLF